MKFFISFILLVIATNSMAQDIDTLVIRSKYFNTERIAYVHKSPFHKYQSEHVQLPIIYILDGQHDWFVEPTLNTIKYLQYTHEIPQALIVVIPLGNRIEECAIVSLEGEDLPLHNFITEELHEVLSTYSTSDINLLLGHSFSASFSLYSYSQSPEFYSAVFANSPADKLMALASFFLEKEIDLTKIYLSIGGVEEWKDKGHRELYNKVKKEFPTFINSIKVYEANSSTHNAVPIVSNPIFFSELFREFRTRFAHIAKTDSDYKLIERPVSISSEMSKFEKSSILLDRYYPMELPEFNGFCSRYENSDLNDYAIKLYEKAIELYPNYYEFHFYLAELLIQTDVALAIEHLRKGKQLIIQLEQDLEGRDELLNEIEELLNQLSTAAEAR
jgi:predicted alpha/beta superfamily hydrolase